ncbi:hypothetical protein [Labrys okinawensis]|uniref:hypothetical protein n=1 Tax=Labrys okinawensis TaxID=346911 RepID=UPI001FDF8169|nr:hypothetical protein [Labrys okinawensis]
MTFFGSCKLPLTNGETSSPVNDDQKSGKARPADKEDKATSADQEVARILARVEREPIPQRLLELAFKLQKALRDAKKAG